MYFGYCRDVAPKYDGDIFLLPMLPMHWESGQVKGLRTPGGFTIDASWKESRVDELTVYQNWTEIAAFVWRVKSAATLNKKP